MEIKKLFKEIKENRWFFRVLWIIGLVIFIVSCVQLGKYRRMKVFYNLGVNLFNEGDYTDAEINFQSALWEKHTKRQECKIRINKALSITTPITPESVTPENLDEKIQRLEEARDCLTVNDCAHSDDSNGHNRKAQTLKEEIDAYIEQLKEQNPKPEENEQQQNGGESDEEKQKAQEEERRQQQQKQMELKEQFNQIEQEGINERNQGLELYEDWNLDFSFDGKSW